MSLTHGMSVDEIERFATRLQNHTANELRRVSREIDALVSQSANTWIGPDAEAFRSWWPAIRSIVVSAADDIHGFGQVALKNVAEQRAASGEGGADEQRGGTAPPPRSTRLDDPDVRQAALDHQAKWLDAAGANRAFPGAMERARAWHARLDAGDPSPQEVAAFQNYMELIKFSLMQRSFVEEAANHAFDQLVQALESGADAISGLAGFEVDGGGLPGGAEVASGMFGEVLGTLDGQIDGATRMVGLDDLAALGPDAMVARFDHDAEAALQQLGDYFEGSDDVGFNDPKNIRLASQDVARSELDIAVQQAEFADAFDPLTGDGSPLDAALRKGLRVLSGGAANTALDGLEIVGGGAQAHYHFESGVAALHYASSGIDALFAVADGMVKDH